MKEMFNLNNFVNLNLMNFPRFRFLFERLEKNIKEKNLDTFYYDKNTDTFYLSKDLIEHKKFFEDFTTVNNYFNKVEIKNDFNDIDLYKEELLKTLNKFSSENRKKYILIEQKKELLESYKLYKNENIASIDCEYTHKRNSLNGKNEYILNEIGYTIKNLKNKKIETKNFIVKENSLNYKSINFNFGKTQTLSLEEIIQTLQKDFKNVKLITGNSISTDMNILKFYGIDLGTQNVIDLSTFFKYFTKNGKVTPALEDITKVLSYKTKNFHNAGNDAYYSIQSFCKLINSFNNSTYEQILKKVKLEQKTIIHNNDNSNTKELDRLLKLKNKLKIFHSTKEFVLKKLTLEETLKEEVLNINRIKNFLMKCALDKSQNGKIIHTFENILLKTIENKNSNFYMTKYDGLICDKNTFLYILKELDKEKINNFKIDFEKFDLSVFTKIDISNIKANSSIKIKVTSKKTERDL